MPGLHTQMSLTTPTALPEQIHSCFGWHESRLSSPFGGGNDGVPTLAIWQNLGQLRIETKDLAGTSLTLMKQTHVNQLRICDDLRFFRSCPEQSTFSGFIFEEQVRSRTLA